MGGARRRQRGEGSIYRRASDGMWIGAVQVGWETGRRRRATVSARTQRQAVIKLAELRRRLHAQGPAPAGTVPTVQAWTGHWLKHICYDRLSPNAYRAADRNLRLYIVPAIGPVRLDRLLADHVRQVDQAIRDRDLGLSTRLSARGTLSRALRDARREGYQVPAVIAAVDPPKGIKSTRTGLVAADARRLLRHVAGDRAEARWAGALMAGLRQGEALGLEWDRVDLDNQVAHVSWQLQAIGYEHGCPPEAHCQRQAGRCPARHLHLPDGYEYRQLHGRLCLVRPKEGRVRYVPVVPALAARLRVQRALYLAERDSYGADHDLVWCRPDGRPIEPGDDRAAWHDLCAAAGVPAVELHSARHTTGTLLLEAGVDPWVVQQILGHADVDTTRGYQHVSVELARGALEQVEQLLQLDPPPTDPDGDPT